jgi:hypothetical protein
VTQTKWPPAKPERSHLEAAVAYYATLGVKVERVMTDNGSCYLS